MMERSSMMYRSKRVEYDAIEGGVTISQLPLLPIVPSTPYLLFPIGSLLGS